MTPNDPQGDQPVSDGDNWLRNIQLWVTQSFPGFVTGTDVTTKTGPELDDAPEKSQAETITGPWTYEATVTFDAIVAMGKDWSIVGTDQAETGNPILVRLNPADDVELGDSGQGTQIEGNALGTYGVTPIPRPTIASRRATLTDAGTVGTLFQDTEYEGYDFPRVVAALRDLGLLT
jgi:hypothetical protein